ncbi:MAG: DUF1659 domain-containing protein [Candidatus Paceibacterota bacterium]
MVEKLHVGSSLQLVFDMGMAGNTQKFRRKSFAGIKTDASLENLQTFANTITGLQTKPLLQTILDEKNELV